MNIKHTLILAFVGLLGLLLPYLAVSFICWESNPGKMSEFNRYCMVAFGAILCFAFVSFTKIGLDYQDIGRKETP